VRTNAGGELIGRSGLTVREWEQRCLDDFLAGRRDTLSRPWEFAGEFYADDEGQLPIEQLQNTVTGAWVALEQPELVHVDDMERYLADWAAKCEAEWKARPPMPSGLPGWDRPWRTP
jgi:hypothetical protein